MTIISQPNIDINIIAANQTISNEPQRVLFVGQMISGTATAGALVTNIGNSGEEDDIFGARSVISQMIRQARVINKVTQFDAIGLADDGSAVDATGSIAFSGTATADGTLTVSVGSKANYSVSVAITSGDTATEVGDTLETAFALLTDAPVTGANSTGTVTFTAANGGTVGNSYGIKVEGNVAGISYTITAFASGATDPSLTDLFDVIEGERYQTIIYQSNLTTSTLTTELDARFNVSNNILDGVGLIAKTDTLANILIAGNAQNSASLVILGNKLLDEADHKGGAMLEFNDVLTAKLGALRSLRLTDGANISQYVISTNGALDSFGGQSIASLPYFNSPITGLPLIEVGKGFSTTEIEQLVTAGVSTLGNNRTRTQVISGEIVTTRKTDAAGNVEETFKFLNSVDTSSAIREFYYNNLRARFAQSRLTEGDLQAGRNIANKAVIESYLDNLFQQMGDASLAQAGENARRFFKLNRTVTLTLISGTATITMQMPIVTQLRNFVATMQIAFSTEG